MICALAIPAYRQQVHVQTAYAWAQDAANAIELGWRPMLLWTDTTGVARARNTIVKIAEDNGARLLLMCDSDTFPTRPDGGLKAMWKTMCDTGAAAVGAAVVVRNGDRVNCEPARPGEVYEGEVGTGYFLIDLVKIRQVPKPWFVYRDSADGLGVECGEDIGFCRLLKAHGHRVVVDYTLAMGHAETGAVATQV